MPSTARWPALLSRRLIALLALLALLTPNGAIAATGADVIRDLRDDGFIQGTYTCAELDEALPLVPVDSGQYGQRVAAIQQKQIETLDEAGRPCLADETSSGGVSGPLVLGIVGAAIAVAVGAAAMLQRRSRRDDTDL